MPVQQRRLRVFRDQQDIDGVELIDALERALRASAKLLVLCSPDSRASSYVAKEIEHFGQLRGKDHVIPLLVRGIPNNEAKPGQEGELAFSDALLALLATPLAAEFRGVGSRDRIDRGQYESAWYKTLTDIYSDYGVTRAQVEQRERRRRLRTLRTWIAGLIAVTLGMSALAAYAWYQRGVAQRERDEAVRQQRIALARQLAAQSESARAERPDLLSRSLLLAAEAAAQSPQPLLEADQALRQASRLSPRLLAQWHVEGGVTAVEASADGKLLAVAQANRIAVRESATGKVVATLPNASGAVIRIAFSTDSQRVLIATGTSATILDVTHARSVCGAMPTGRAVAALSPDGALLVTAPKPDQIAVIRLEDCTQIAELTVLRGVGQEVRQAGFTPDGRYLAAGNLAAVAVWRLGDWQNDLVPKGNERWTTYAFAFRADSARLISVSPRGLRTLALAESGGTEISNDANPESMSATAAMYSPDGTRVGVLGTNGAAIYTLAADDANAPSERNALRLGGTVRVIAFSPDSSTVAAAADDGTIGIWNLTSEEQVARIVEPATAVSIAFAPDGKSLLTVDKDGGVRIWSVAPLRDASNPCPFDPRSFAIDTDGRFTLYECGDRVWRGGARTGELQGDAVSDLHSVRLAPDGRRFASAASDTIRIWDASTLKAVGTLQHAGQIDWNTLEARVRGKGHQLQSMVSQLQSTGDTALVAGLSANGRYAATVGADDTARIWDANGARELARIPVTFDVAALPFGNRDAVAGVWATFSPDTRFVAVIDRADSHEDPPPAANLHVIELSDGKALPALAHPAGAHRAAFDAAGRYLATSSNDGVARLWDIAHGKLIAQLEGLGSEPKLLFSNDGRYFATGSGEGTARLLDTSAIVLRTLAPQPDAPSHPLAFDAQSTRLAIAVGISVRIYDVAGGRAVRELPHVGRVEAADFSADGRYLATTIGDARTFVWSLDTGAEIARIKGTSDVHAVRFAEQGDVLATDVDLRRWRTADLVQEACARVATDLTAEQWRTYLGDLPRRACATKDSVGRAATSEDLAKPVSEKRP